MRCRVVRLREGAKLPEYHSKGAAGADVYAVLRETLVLGPLQRVQIPTGIAVEIDPGYELQIRTRSGLSFNEGLVVINSPATIDSDFRGEIKVILTNLDSQPKTVNPGDRIAQLVLQKVQRIYWEEVKLLEPSERGSKGFGSTGK